MGVNWDWSKSLGIYHCRCCWCCRPCGNLSYAEFLLELQSWVPYLKSDFFPDEVQFSSVQSLSRVWLFATPWTAARQAFLSITKPPEFTQTHVHWVGDAMQPSHPLSSPSSPASNPSQHQDLFQWVSSLHQVAKVLESKLQHQFFQWTLRTDLL